MRSGAASEDRYDSGGDDQSDPDDRSVSSHFGIFGDLIDDIVEIFLGRVFMYVHDDEFFWGDIKRTIESVRAIQAFIAIFLPGFTDSPGRGRAHIKERQVKALRALSSSGAFGKGAGLRPH